ncbi:hypothetical protein TBR22_A04720 [Luteitalea sp. TBR-22]|uniref:heparinase II/III domain-containing protein n=1 Tax=Luteitalea sp. TBR-22 TaxID=2802971 RepID=UPI001AF45054|nr:heparinase II/III family protein [Luteitalea sp. TBR-22]BCS31272.1 hypothetical protein TBR22_A04720 [Luteitalea sp. TBR-22]
MERRQGLRSGSIDRRTCLGALAAPVVAATWDAQPGAPERGPRLLFTREELDRVRARASHPQLVRFRDTTLAKAEQYVSAPRLVPSITGRGEPDPPGEDKGLACARALQGRVVTLGMAWELTGEARFLESAIAQLEHAVRSWHIWVDTAHQPPFDLMTGELSLTFALAIDWLLPAVADDRRRPTVDGVVRRALDAFLEAVEREKPPAWHTAQHNWNTVCNGGAAMLALALQPTHADKAARVLARAVPAMERYWDHLGPDGAWDEGTGYWRYGHRYGLMAAEALRRAGHPAGAAVFARSGVRQTGYFPIVFNPGTTLSASFGDSNGRAADAIFYLLGATYRDPAFIWYQDRVPVPRQAEGWPDEALALLWRPVDQPWLPERQRDYLPRVPAAAVFPSIGWALLAPSQPDPAHFLAFKNGSLAANHTHLDLNHVSLAVGDRFLLAELGSRPYPADYFRADKRHGYYEIGTGGHNTVLVGGKGQVHRRKGRLLPLVDRDGVQVLTGVADDTYDVPTPIARRHVIALDERQSFVIVDEIETAEPQPIELRWHTGGTWALGPSGSAVVTNGPVRAAVRTLALSGVPPLEVATPEGWIRPVQVLSARLAASPQHLVVTAIAPGEAEAPSLSLARSRDGRRIQLRVGERQLRFRTTAEGGLQPV